MGSLKEVNGRLTVLASLVQARDGAMVWADQFDRGPDELAAVRDEIAKAVGDSLRVKAGQVVRCTASRPAAAHPQSRRVIGSISWDSARSRFAARPLGGASTTSGAPPS